MMMIRTTLMMKTMMMTMMMTMMKTMVKTVMGMIMIMNEDTKSFFCTCILIIAVIMTNW